MKIANNIKTPEDERRFERQYLPVGHEAGILKF